MHNPNFASTNLNYGASKNAAALLLQLMARNVSDNEIQILSFHPGDVLTVTARAYGFDENSLPWDDCKLIKFSSFSRASMTSSLVYHH